MRAIASRFTLASVVFIGLAVICLANEEAVEIDAKSGLRIDAEGNWQLIQAYCNVCHSGKTVDSATTRSRELVKGDQAYAGSGKFVGLRRQRE